MKRTILPAVLIISLLTLGIVSSCSQDDLQEAQIEILMQDLSEANDQLAAVQERLFNAQILEEQYDDLSDEYDSLTAANDANIEEIASLGVTIEALGDEITILTNTNEAYVVEIEALQTEYDSLKAQYDLLVGLGAEISEENIAEALYDLINQERIAHGLNALIPGHNLEDWSLVNCQDMAISKQAEYYDNTWIPFQRVFIAVGYSSLDRIVNGAMLMWQSHQLSYEKNILNDEAIYGAVSVVQLGEIFYITYMASNFP